LSAVPVLRLELRASRALAAAVVFLHAAAASGVILVAPGAAGTGLAVAILALGALAAWNRALLRGSASVRILELGGGREVGAVLASGRRLQGRAAARCHVGPWWVILRLASPRRSLLVARGMLAPEEFRRLRLWALWGRLPAPVRAG
jgi:hypothetical protein